MIVTMTSTVHFRPIFGLQILQIPLQLPLNFRLNVASQTGSNTSIPPASASPLAFRYTPTAAQLPGCFTAGISTARSPAWPRGKSIASTSDFRSAALSTARSCPTSLCSLPLFPSALFAYTHF